MRLYRTIALIPAVLLAGLAAQPVCAPASCGSVGTATLDAEKGQPEEAPSDAPADVPAGQPQPADSTGQEEEGAAPEEAEGEAKPEPPAPEGVKRLPPGTSEEEREYKKRKTREDPFLTSPQANDPAPFYNPADWLRKDVPFGLSRFMVQDASGKVLGHLTVDIRSEKHPVEGELVHIVEASDYGLGFRLEAWVFAGSFRPRRAEISHQQTPDSPADTASRVVADYLFDRLTVTENHGEVSTQKQSRLLPFTFDSSETLLLVRQLQFVRGDWPFEAGLLDFASAETRPFIVAAPKISDCIAADGVSYGCYVLMVTIGADKGSYWVERANPHRLVKFERGGLVFTLLDYRAV